MQQKISIKKKTIKSEQGEHSFFYVPAISLKNSDNEVKLLVPHPTGNDVMEFNSLAEAAGAIRKAGFEYKLPDGEIIEDTNLDSVVETVSRTNDIEQLLFKKFQTKTNDINPSIVASSIMALSYLNNKKAIDIFLEKIGEDNEKIRTAAMEALINCQSSVVDRLIDTLTNPNWVSRNSAISCLSKISEFTDVEPEKILIPIINRIDDENTIVQANAILTAGKIYKNCMRRSEK